MTGFYIVIGPCFVCGRPFGYNAERVPSIPIDDATGEISAGGDRKPICSSCIVIVNEKRKAAGMPTWPVYDDAYAPSEGFPP